MTHRTLAIIAAIACWPSLAQQNTPPQRTITNRPDSSTADAKPTPPAAPANPSAALEQYRAMWNKMTPAQQKALTSAGGPTPDQYERMLLGRGTASAKGAKDAGPDSTAANSGAFDALSKSLQDLNAVRDGNLTLVQKDGCAPELASRIADLKARLRSDEFQLNGTEAPAAASTDPHTSEKTSADAMAVAGDWFKHPPDSKPAAHVDDARRTRESSQLDAVLAGAPSAPAAEGRKDPNSPAAEQNRKILEADMVRVQAELDQLSSACAAAKK